MWAISAAFVYAGCESESRSADAEKESTSRTDKPTRSEQPTRTMPPDAAATDEGTAPTEPMRPSQMDKPPVTPDAPPKPSHQPDAAVPPPAAGAAGSSPTKPPSGDEDPDLDAGSAPSEPPEKLLARIKDVSAEGALCPAGSTSTSVSSDLAALTLTFSAAGLSSGPGENLEGSCRIHMQLDVPDGYQFSGLRVAPSGYLFALDGAASFGLSYAFTGDSAGQSFEHPNLTGDRDVVFAEVADQVWSPSCDSSVPKQTLELVVELRLAARDDASISLIAFDLDFTQADARWRTCGARVARSVPAT